MTLGAFAHGQDSGSQIDSGGPSIADLDSKQHLQQAMGEIDDPLQRTAHCLDLMMEVEDRAKFDLLISFLIQNSAYDKTQIPKMGEVLRRNRVLPRIEISAVRTDRTWQALDSRLSMVISELLNRPTYWWPRDGPSPLEAANGDPLEILRINLEIVANSADHPDHELARQGLEKLAFPLPEPTSLYRIENAR